MYCKPFKRMSTGHSGSKDADASSSTRMDYVFFTPPPPFYASRCTDFQQSPENAWFGRVSLLFTFQLRHDDGGIREEECAIIDDVFNYADSRYFCQL